MPPLPSPHTRSQVSTPFQNRCVLFCPQRRLPGGWRGKGTSPSPGRSVRQPHPAAHPRRGPRTGSRRLARACLPTSAGMFLQPTVLGCLPSNSCRLHSVTLPAAGPACVGASVSPDDSHTVICVSPPQTHPGPGHASPEGCLSYLESTASTAPALDIWLLALGWHRECPVTALRTGIPSPGS